MGRSPSENDPCLYVLCIMGIPAPQPHSLFSWGGCDGAAPALGVGRDCPCRGRYSARTGRKRGVVASFPSHGRAARGEDGPQETPKGRAHRRIAGTAPALRVARAARLRGAQALGPVRRLGGRACRADWHPGVCGVRLAPYLLEPLDALFRRHGSGGSGAPSIGVLPPDSGVRVSAIGASYYVHFAS
jgi:hypothetical protein